jgi:hypothetical protein
MSPHDNARNPKEEQSPIVAAGLNLYIYAMNRPTTLVDPNGRKPVALPAALPVVAPKEPRSATKPLATGAPPPASSDSKSSGAKSAAGKGAGKGFFESIASGLHAAAEWIRDWLPGIIAAPLAGLIDIFAGFARTLGGIFSGKGSTAVQGLKDMGLGALSIIGLKEIVSEKFDTPIGTSVNFKGPKTLAKDIKDASKLVWDMNPRGSPGDPAKNGMHSWHAATNAAVANRLGPLGAALLWIGGLVHESPIDWGSFQAEQRAQGTVNHILDSSTDIVANTFGILVGFLLPRKVAVKAAAFLGNYIPGPGDPDPTGAGTGGYHGNPVDAWGQYPH